MKKYVKASAGDKMLRYEDLNDVDRESIEILSEKSPYTPIMCYITTQSPYFYCFCYGQSEDGLYDDIAQDIEDTLHILLDAGYDDREIHTILGAVKMSYDEAEEEYGSEDDGEWFYIDEDYIIVGQIANWVPVNTSD